MVSTQLRIGTTSTRIVVLTEQNNTIQQLWAKSFPKGRFLADQVKSHVLSALLSGVTLLFLSILFNMTFKYILIFV